MRDSLAQCGTMWDFSCYVNEVKNISHSMESIKVETSLFDSLHQKKKCFNYSK